MSPETLSRRDLGRMVSQSCDGSKEQSSRSASTTVALTRSPKPSSSDEQQGVAAGPPHRQPDGGKDGDAADDPDEQPSDGDGRRRPQLAVGTCVGVVPVTFDHGHRVYLPAPRRRGPGASSESPCCRRTRMCAACVAQGVGYVGGTVATLRLLARPGVPQHCGSVGASQDETDAAGPPDPAPARSGSSTRLLRSAASASGQVLEHVERVGVRQRALAAASTGVPVRIRLTGTSSFLPDSVRGIAGTAWICVGHVARRQRRPQGRGDPRRAARRRARRPSREHDEQQQLAGAALRVLEVHDEAVRDLGQRLDDRVELGGAEPHAAAVERGVGAAGDDARAARR